MLTFWRDLGRDTRWVLTSYFLWGIGEGLWMFIQPLYVEYLGATPAQSGLVIGMWGLGRLLLVLPAGVLADRLGARKMMAPGWFMGFTGVLIIALAPDWRWAVPGFLMYGFSAIAIPVTNLYVAQAARHDPTRRADLPVQASFTALWAAYSLGIMITPAIGGWLGDHIGLRAVFLISVGWFLLSTLAFFQTRAYPTEERATQNWRAYRSLLRQIPVIAAFGVITVGFIGVMTGQTLSAQFLEDVRAYSRTSIGAFGSLNALGTAVFSLWLGRWIPWRGFLASLLIVSGAFGLLLASGSPMVVVVAMFMLGSYYATRPLATSVISALVPPHQRGMAFGLVETLSGLASLVGANLAGVMFAADPGVPFYAGIAVLAAVVLVGARVLRRSANVPEPRDADPAPAYSPVEAK